MYNKFFSVCLVTALAMLSGSDHVMAKLKQMHCGPAYSDLDDGITMEILYQQYHVPAKGAVCQNVEACKALEDLSCAVTAYAQRLTPNSLAYLSSRHARRAQVRFGRNIQALGREHPQRIPLYCIMLTQVAPTLTGDESKDGRTAQNLWNMALRLDRPGNHCFDRVAAATPPQAAQAYDLDWYRHCHRTWRTCRRTLEPPG